MFSLTLVLVCDQVLILSWNLCENGYWDNLHIGHIGYNGFYVQARVDDIGWVLLGLLLIAFANFGK
jgi:hypothetical protein